MSGVIWGYYQWAWRIAGWQGVRNVFHFSQQRVTSVTVARSRLPAWLRKWLGWLASREIGFLRKQTRCTCELWSLYANTMIDPIVFCSKFKRRREQWGMSANTYDNATRRHHTPHPSPRLIASGETPSKKLVCEIRTGGWRAPCLSDYSPCRAVSWQTRP